MYEGIEAINERKRKTESIVLLATGETRTLSLLMLDFAAGGELERATVVAAIIVLLVVVLSVIVRFLGGQLSIRG